MKIIGKGLLARRFESLHLDSQYVIFASGVSNSAEDNKLAFKRELELLLEASRSGPLVYFGSCSVELQESNWTPYIRHKFEMERLVVDKKLGIVVRLPNVIGNGGNPKTMFNYFCRCILTGSEIIVKTNATRSLIDLDDVAILVGDVLTQRELRQNWCERVYRFVLPQQYLVTDIVAEIERCLQIKAIVKISGEDFLNLKSSSYVNDAISRGVIHCNDDYLVRLVSKYIDSV